MKLLTNAVKTSRHDLVHAFLKSEKQNNINKKRDINSQKNDHVITHN